MWKLEKYSGNVAFIDENENQITYKDLTDSVKEFSQKIKERCLVFSLCSNTIGSVVGYTAFVENRIVPLLLNNHIERGLLDNLLNTYLPKYIWAPKSMEDFFSKAAIVYSNYDYCLFCTNYEKEYALDDELGLLLTTSGSTGSPKLVRQSYRNMRVNAEQIAEYLQLEESERPITTLPMNYTYGLSIINSHLFVGAAILLTEKTLMQKEFWNFFKQQKATSFGGVPYTYEILNKLKFFRMDLPSLRTMTQAGGKLSPELHKSFAEYAMQHSKKFIVMYGQCEATARMAYLPYEKSLEKYGSMGIAIPRGKFSLIDVDGNIIDCADEVGELVYEGPNVTLGYAEEGSDLCKGDERKGRLVTGDMAKRDKDGFYYIVGRKKRFLKIYGNRVNLDEVDRLLKSEFDEIDCASAGMDDHLYVFVTAGGMEESICRFISEKTGLNRLAFVVKKIDEIPRNDAGKTLYKELEKYYEL